MTASQNIKRHDFAESPFLQPENTHELTEAIEGVVTDKVQSGERVFESSTRKDLDLLRSEMREGNASLKGELRAEMREQKVDMIK